MPTGTSLALPMIGLVLLAAALPIAADEQLRGSNDEGLPWAAYEREYDYRAASGNDHKAAHVQLGPRPGYLIAGMTDSELKQQLLRCRDREPRRTDFSIGHRGAPMQFPEHTVESYEAAAVQGAGILECDVIFTRDGTLVCRHSECDLHTTTNILETDLAARCSEPFAPATLNPDGSIDKPASALCCTSDLHIDEFRQLQGKRDSANPQATTVDEYMQGMADWRTDVDDARGTLLTHAESIELFESLGAKFTPELKAANPDTLAAAGMTQASYAQKMIDEYKIAGISPRKVWAQSFNIEDVEYWIENEPNFGRQAVFLDGRNETGLDPNWGDPAAFEPTMEELAERGVEIIAPPMYFLLNVTDDGQLVPSPYAIAARNAGLEIITWTFERSDLRNGSRIGGTGPDGRPNATFYYAFDRNPEMQVVTGDGDMYEVLDVLARDVGILGIFSDWPATVTYYANCMNLD